MTITVASVLTLSSFKGARIVAGSKGIHNIINHASLMEVPDIFNYVDANNLLITTLYPIYNNEEAIKTLIPKLAEKNLAGICIKPIRYVKEIPAIMLQQANELNFPVIELPPDANLSTLVNQILELALNKHINTLKFRNFVHEELMNLFLRGADIKTLIDSLAKMVGYPILLLDRNREIISLSQELENQQISLHPLEGNQRENAALRIKVNDREYLGDRYIEYSIKAGKTGFGYIVLLKGDGNNPNLLVAVEQAALLIASVFYKNNAVLEKEKNFQDAFIRDILQGKIKSQLETINKAKAFGWSLEFPQVIGVIRVFEENELMKKRRYEYLIGSGIVEGTFSKRLSINTNRIKTIYLDDSLVVFVNALFINSIKESCMEIGRSIIESYKHDGKLGIGISDIIENINRFPQAYREAQDTLNLGAILNKGSFVSHYDDYQMFHLIKEIKEPDLLRRFMTDRLGRLMAYDQANETDLMNTLRVLMEENFNAKRAAERLYVHYNTLRYRVEKIKELGVQFENGLQIGELVLAYNIYLWLRANHQI